MFNPALLEDSTIINGTDIKINFNLTFDHNYLQIVKQNGRLILIGNAIVQQAYHWRDLQRSQEQKVVWIKDGSVGVPGQNNWALEKTQNGFVPDQNKQVKFVSLLSVSPTKKLLCNAVGSQVQIFNL